MNPACLLHLLTETNSSGLTPNLLCHVFLIPMCTLQIYGHTHLLPPGITNSNATHCPLPTWTLCIDEANFGNPCSDLHCI